MANETFDHKTLARLFHAVDHSQLPAARQDLLAIVEHEPFKTTYRHLEQLAEQAGTPRQWNGWEHQAVTLHETFDLLLATEGWNELGIFDPDHESGPIFLALLNVCRARQKAGQGDHERLLALEQKLLAAAARQCQLHEREQQLELGLRTTLLRLLGPGGHPEASCRLIELLERLAAALRCLPLSASAGDDPPLAEPAPVTMSPAR